MRRLFYLLMVMGYLKGFSQTMNSFRPLRYDEDYASWKNESKTCWYTRLKYATLSNTKESYASFGGELRFQYIYRQNEGWGGSPANRDGYILNRYLFHADLHTSKKLRAFVQLQSSLAGSRIKPSPVDHNPLELHQAFADLKLELADDALFTFRVGRQEFIYGSQRLIGLREGSNNRQSFDAVKSFFSSGNFQADLFYGHNVVARKRIFDDGPSRNTRLWAVYLVQKRLPVIRNLDLYYIGLWNQNRSFDDGRKKEMRHTTGTRLWNSESAWNWDIELSYQSGKLADDRISAWAVSFNTSYTFSRKNLKPKLGLKAELISGDRLPDDGRLNTFNPLFRPGSYFSQATLISPVNLVNVHPTLALTMTRRLIVNADYDIFWRFSRHDGLYTLSGSLVDSIKMIPDRFFGTQPSFALSYTASEFITINTEVAYFDTKGYLKATGKGNNKLFILISSQLRF